MGQEELHTGSSRPSCLPEECMTLPSHYIALPGWWLAIPLKKKKSWQCSLSVSQHTWPESTTTSREEGFLGPTCAAVQNIRDHLHASVTDYLFFLSPLEAVYRSTFERENQVACRQVYRLWKNLWSVSLLPVQHGMSMFESNCYLTLHGKTLGAGSAWKCEFPFKCGLKNWSRLINCETETSVFSLLYFKFVVSQFNWTWFH